MINYLYLLKHNDAILGIFDNKTILEETINGLTNNLKLDNELFEIIKCYPNSLNPTIFREKKVKVKELTVEEVKIKDEEDKKSKEEKQNEKELKQKEEEEKAKQKAELNHKKNMLKYHKERLESKKNEYENDLLLFDRFMEEKSKDNNFEIPPLFIKKYDIIKNLTNENNLTFENYLELTDDQFMENSYHLLFE
jgi:flagellar biosynthesis GTPase FlhF